MKKRLYIFLTGIILFITAVCTNISQIKAEVHIKDKRVLFLSSYSYDWESIPKQLQGIKKTLSDRCTMKYVFMDNKNITYEDSKDYIYDQIETDIDLYGNYDVVIAGDDTAVDFIEEYRNVLFDNIPVVYEGVNNVERAKKLSQDPLITGVVETFPVKETINLAREIFPRADKIVAITDDNASGNGSLEQFYDTKEEFEELEYSHIYTSLYTRNELIDIIKKFDNKTIVLFLLMNKDKDGNVYSNYEATKLISDNSHVPVFKTDELGIGDGFLGGVVISYEDMAADAADMALSIINGQKPERISYKTTSQYTLLDKNILKKYKIDKNVLKSDNIRYINQQDSFMKVHKNVIIPSVAIVIILVIWIISLLYISRRRAIYMKELQEKDIMMDNIANNVPGGIAIFKIPKDIGNSIIAKEINKNSAVSDSVKNIVKGVTDNISTLIEIMYYNDGIPRLTERDRDEFGDYIKKNTLRATVYKEDIPRVENELAHKVAVGAPINITYRVLRKSGRFLWVRLSAVKLREEDNCNVYSAVYTRLSEEEEVFRSVSEDASIGVYMCEKNTYNLIYANKEVRNNIAGSQNYKDTKCYEYIMHRDSPCKNCIQKYMKEGKAEYSEFRDIRTGRIYFVKEKLIKCNDRDVMIKYLSDETDRYRAIKEAEQLRVAKASNEAKGSFLARMSHDLRTPLNAIVGFSEENLVNESTEQEKNEYFERIHSSSKYLLSLINDILDMSKVNSGKFTLQEIPMRITDSINDINNIISPLAQKRKINYKVITTGLKHDNILADKMRFEQIFINLLNNAVKFTQPLGNVTFKISNEYVDNDRNDNKNTGIKKGKMAKKGRQIRCTFVVRDDGKGMSKEYLPHLFEPFVQSKDQYNQTEGTGLGLSIVKGIIDEMKGKISVKSQLGFGTEFTVELILSESESISSNVKNAWNGSGNIYDNTILKDRNILLCEDNEMNRQIAGKILEKMGINITFAVNGKDGVEKFAQSEDGFFDLVFMDIRMPVMDGLSAAKNIRAMKRDDSMRIPIIAMTANAYDEDITKSEQAGMNYHLAKPIDSQLMCQKMIEYIRIYRNI